MMLGADAGPFTVSHAADSTCLLAHPPRVPEVELA